MRKLKKIGLLFTTTIIVLTPISDVVAEEPIIIAPKVDIMTNTNFELSTKMGRFEPFGKIGVVGMPLKQSYNEIWVSGGRTYEFNVNRTNYAISFDVGGRIRITDYSKIIGRFETVIGPLYDRIGFYGGYEHTINFSPKADLIASAKAFIDLTHMFEESKESSTEHERAGLKLGLEYEHFLTKNLSARAGIGFFQGIPGLFKYNYSGSADSELNFGLGLRYRFRPNLRTNIKPLDWSIPSISLPDRQPKQSQVKPKKHRPSNISCPAHRHRSWERPPSVFNRVGK